MRPLIALTIAASLLLPLEAAANWPQPAAGESVSGNPEIIFTFDDGPDHRFTPRVLKLLRERNIQAIFYWVGHRIDQRKKHADLRRAVATRAQLEGHVIGTHTINHVHLCSLPTGEGAAEIDGAIREYGALTGLPMILFRAPYGDHCDRVISLLNERGLSHTHWDMDPREWLDHDSERVASYFISKLRRLDGRAVILMHDTKLVTVRALEKVLDWLDKENARRRISGEPTIRVVNASDWVAERLDPDLSRFATELGDALWTRVSLAGQDLVPGYPTRVVSRH